MILAFVLIAPCSTADAQLYNPYAAYENWQNSGSYYARPVYYRAPVYAAPRVYGGGYGGEYGYRGLNSFQAQQHAWNVKRELQNITWELERANRLRRWRE